MNLIYKIIFQGFKVNWRRTLHEGRAHTRINHFDENEMEENYKLNIESKPQSEEQDEIISLLVEVNPSEIKEITSCKEDETQGISSKLKAFSSKLEEFDKVKDLSF